MGREDSIYLSVWHGRLALCVWWVAQRIYRATDGCEQAAITAYEI